MGKHKYDFISWLTDNVSVNTTNVSVTLVSEKKVHHGGSHELI